MAADYQTRLYDVLSGYASKIALTGAVEEFRNPAACSEHDSLNLNPYHSSKDSNSGNRA